MYLRWIKSTRRLKRIIVLWALLLFQLFLIALFVGFGITNSNDIDDGMTHIDVGIIQFVTEEKNDLSASAVTALADDVASRTAAIQSILATPSGHFHKEFVNCYREPIDNETIPFYCYRNGSIEPSQIFTENDADNQDCTCKCQPNYHGKDCGQPEVVWRAFMAARLSRSDVGQTSATIHGRLATLKPSRIFYIIEATALSISTIEMQFMELIEVVDLFILCDQIANKSNADPNSITSRDHSFSYQQSSYQHSNEFFLKRFKHKTFIVKTVYACSSKLMYKHLRETINSVYAINPNEMRRDDILLYSRADEILNRQAIAYLKWYSDWSQAQPIRFRLKYTVYGFYWQHPDHTILSSFACQLHVLDEVYGGDPNRVMLDKNNGMIFGDLNHFGGWYCQYCYESPINIVQKLHADKDTNVFDKSSMDRGVAKSVDNMVRHKSPKVIDSNYIQSLISAGLFIDQRTNLIRLHRYSDKYYAPDYVNGKGSRYDFMLTNVYANYDNDIIDDE